LSVVWHELEQVIAAQIPGDIVEFGCYAGTTSVFIRRLLNQQGVRVGAGQHQANFERAFHVYDSFEGLPDKTSADQNAAGVDFAAGKLYVSKADFIKVFRGARLELPIIHKGWFKDLGGQDVPEQIAFGFLDGDFYESILDSLRLVWPRLRDGGTICIDDYQRETLPGVQRAVREYFGRTLPLIKVQHNIAIISKQ